MKEAAAIEWNLFRGGEVEEERQQIIPIITYLERYLVLYPPHTTHSIRTEFLMDNVDRSPTPTSTH